MTTSMVLRLARVCCVAAGLTITLNAHAGTYVSSVFGLADNSVTHPRGYDGTGGQLPINVCIDSSSAHRNQMVGPVQRAIETLNNLNPTTLNLRVDNTNVPVDVFDFESVALHEMGHANALGHTDLGGAALDKGSLDIPQNYTFSRVGSNGAFDFGAGLDGASGTADDLRGDDVNLNWHNPQNNPFVLMDLGSYSQSLGILPFGDTYSANGGWVTSIFTGDAVQNPFTLTQAVMHWGTSTNSDVRQLAADDVAMYLMAQRGLDHLPGTADDYTTAYSYGGFGTKGSQCDIVLDFDSAVAEDGLGVTFVVAIEINSTNSVIGAQQLIFFNDDVNWFFGAGAGNGDESFIDQAFSGSFGDPVFSGQGINIEILVEQGAAGKGLPGVALVYWYSFDPFGFPFFSFGVGDIIEDTIEVDMLFDYDGSGPFFGPAWDVDQFIATDFASVTIVANDCDNLSFNFNLATVAGKGAVFEEHTMELDRITTPLGLPCPTNKSAPHNKQQLGWAKPVLDRMPDDVFEKLGGRGALYARFEGENKKPGIRWMPVSAAKRSAAPHSTRINSTAVPIEVAPKVANEPVGIQWSFEPLGDRQAKGIFDIQAELVQFRTLTGGIDAGSEVTAPETGQTIVPYFQFSTGDDSVFTVDVLIGVDTPLCGGPFDIPSGGPFLVTIWCDPGWDTVAGNHTLFGEVDPDDLLAEADENNNRVQRNYTVTGQNTIDIIADAVEFRTESDGEGSQVNSPAGGQSLFPYLYFTTIGTAKADKVDFDAEITMDGQVLCGGPLAGVPANGAFFIFCVQPWSAVPGNRSLAGEVDVFDVIAEDSELNNAVKRDYNITGGGGALITDAWTGSFYDPLFSGEGVNTEVLAEEVVAKDGKGGSPGVVLLYWYSYDSFGLPFFAFGVGTIVGDTMVVEMLFDYDGNGPFFGPDWNTSQFTAVPFATVTIVWADCFSGLMTFVVDAAFAAQFPAHAMFLERITTVVGLECAAP